MDELYALILLGFKWSNKTFVKGYDQVMGTILTSKVPLSANAIKSLHAEIVQLPNVLQLLKPLLLPEPDSAKSSRGSTNQTVLFLTLSEI